MVNVLWKRIIIESQAMIFWCKLIYINAISFALLNPRIFVVNGQWLIIMFIVTMKQCPKIINANSFNSFYVQQCYLCLANRDFAVVRMQPRIFFHKLSSLDNFEHQIGSHHIQINQFTQNCKINVTNLLYEHTIQPLHHGMLLILFSRFFTLFWFSFKQG